MAEPSGPDCLYCGRSAVDGVKMTKAHVVGDVMGTWLSESIAEIAGPDVDEAFRAAQTRITRTKPGQEASEVHEWPMPLLQRTVREVCGPCNNEWTQRSIETPAAPALRRLVTFEAFDNNQLTDWEAERVAAWLMQSSLLGGVAEGYRSVMPRSPIKYLRSTSRAHPAALVLLGRAVAPLVWGRFTPFAHSSGRPHGFLSVLAVGGLLGVVIYPAVSIPELDDSLDIASTLFDAEWLRSLLPIHPYRHRGVPIHPHEVDSLREITDLAVQRMRLT